MTATSGKTASPLFEPPHLADDVLRYGAALTLVAATFCGIALALGHAPVEPEASEPDSAMMIDLPPAENSRAAAEAENVATAAAAQRQNIEHTPKPPEVLKPEPATEPMKLPAPAPDATLEKQAEPPTKTAQPRSSAQAPAEAGVRADVDNRAGDEGTPHASAHEITLWQKALMRRLEAAKRNHHHAMNLTGIVKVAFEIDRQGVVRTVHVASSSGVAALDATAVALVRDASPVPAPPAGAGGRDLSFVVPIRFKR